MNQYYVVDYSVDSSESLFLNDKTIEQVNILKVLVAGFYKFSLKLSDSTISKSFVLIDAERGDSELGLKPRTPKTFVETECLVGEIVITHPKNLLSGIYWPVAVFTNSVNRAC